MIIQVIIGLLFIAFASLAEGIEWKERYSNIDKKERSRLNRLWHLLQFFERVFAVAFGWSVGYAAGLSFDAIKIIFFIAVMFWIVYDVTINFYAGRPLLKPSLTTTSTMEKYYWLKPILLILAILFLVGCSSSAKIVEQTTIRIDSIKVASPTVIDTLQAKIITDTVVISTKVIEKDTVIDVRYYPVEKKFFVKVKPDTVTVVKIDTVKKVEYKQAESDRNFLWILAIGFIVLIIVIIIKIRS